MRSLALAVLALAPALPALADTVYLANGNKFEEVVAERRGDQVRVRMPYGEIVLPGRVVARVERSTSAWQEYAEREAQLVAAEAGSADWLALSRWARDAGDGRGMRRALLRAAEIDPRLDGLEPMMSRIGYILDADIGRWVSEQEYMERRGYVRSGDRWLPREVWMARQRGLEAEESRRREEARQERITRAIEALAVAELSRRRAEREPPRTEPGPSYPVAAFPGSYFPVVGGVAPLFGGVAVGGVVAAKGRLSFEDLTRRQPGSLLPVAPRRRHLTSRD